MAELAYALVSEANGGNPVPVQIRLWAQMRGHSKSISGVAFFLHKKPQILHRHIRL